MSDELTRDELLAYIVGQDNRKNPGFDPETVANVLGCEGNDKRFWGTEDVDFSAISTERLKAIVTYMKAAIFAEKLASEL